MQQTSDNPTRKPKPPERATIDITKTVAAQLRAIADRRDITMSQALEKYAGAAILREYRKVVDEMARELGGEG